MIILAALALASTTPVSTRNDDNFIGHLVDKICPMTIQWIKEGKSSDDVGDIMEDVVNKLDLTNAQAAIVYYSCGAYMHGYLDGQKDQASDASYQVHQVRLER